MEICSACGNKSLMPERFGDMALCKICALKLLMPSWVNKEYSSNLEVEEQKERVLNLARRNHYPLAVVSKLTVYFENKKINGLVKILKGQEGQDLTVCEDYCILQTKSDFDYVSAERAYNKILSGERGGDSSLDELGEIMRSPVASGIISGIMRGSLTKGIIGGIGRGVAEGLITQDKKTEKRLLSVYTGERVIKYSEYDIVQCFEPVGQESYGFVIFQKSAWVTDPSKNIVFFFGNNSDLKCEVNQLCEFIQKRINEIREASEREELRKQEYEAAKREQQAEREQQERRLSAEAVTDAILKYKQLLDMGAITEEEFSAKKKQLLGI